MPVSRATLLRQVQTRALPQQPAPRIIGIDEWAWRRDHRYGTLICDRELHRVLDVLPDRSVASVAHWLQQHPQMTTVCRDRSGLFAEAINQGAPQATHVGDRWHLLHNLREVLEPLFTRYKTALKDAMPPSRLATRAMRPSHRAVSPDQEATRHRRHEQNVQRYQRIHA